MITTSFPSRLKEVRGKLGLTQKEMAEKLGCSRASYAYYETDKNTPDINFLKALHENSGFPIEYLLGYSDNYTEKTQGLDKLLGLSMDAVQNLIEDETIQKTINRLLESKIVSFAAISLCAFNIESANTIQLIEKKGRKTDIIDTKKMETLIFAMATDFIKDIFKANNVDDVFNPYIDMNSIKTLINTAGNNHK
jgi:transcriptional regulator with XRE-family HTH domain